MQSGPDPHSTMPVVPFFTSKYQIYWHALRHRWLTLVSASLTLIAMIGLLWWGIEQTLAEKEEASRRLVMAQVSARAASYAVQIEDLTDRMTQVAESITAEWRRSPQTVNLKENVAGLLSRRHPLYVIILDDSAQVVSASFVPKATSIPRLDYFEDLRANCCPGWLVSPVSYAPVIGERVVRFSRRLNRPDGSFGGVLVFGALPNFLETFQDDSLIAPGDFVTVRLLDGPVLMTKLGAGQPTRVFYRNNPAFDAAAGVRLEAGKLFADGRARYVAWRKHSKLPLVALASMSADDALVEFRATASSYRGIALLATAALLLAGVVIVIGVASFGARRMVQEEVQRTYRLATDAANEGYYMLRPLYAASGTITELIVEDCNEQAAVMLGLPRDLLVGARAGDLLAPSLYASLQEACERTVRFGAIEDEYRVPPGTQLRASWVHRRLVHSGAGIALSMRDISELKAHEEELNRLANNDALTGLPNRHWLMHQLPLAIDRAQRSHGQMALLFIDLDNFKMVNDTLGHDKGDELLVEAAERLRHAVRASDQVARLGGDEFTVILEQAVTPAVVAQVAMKILQVLCEPFRTLESAAVNVSASIGASVWPTDGTTPDMLLKNADVAMYAAKAAGRAQYKLYDPQMSDALFARLDAEEALRAAMVRNELLLHFQPRIDANNGQLRGFEALVRWQHPQRGQLMPGEFLDMADEAGLNALLGDHLVSLLVRQLAGWHELGLDVPVSFNVTGAQLRSGRLAACLREQLALHDISPQQLEIEIPEAVIVERRGPIAGEIDALRRLGVRIAIDDFGTGHSALSQLLHLKLDTMKIDRDFTELLTKEPGVAPLYRAIVSMAKALNMRVIAEGVESLDQLALLQSFGCDEVQGPLVCSAVGAENVPGMFGGGMAEAFERLARRASGAARAESAG